MQLTFFPLSLGITVTSSNIPQFVWGGWASFHPLLTALWSSGFSWHLSLCHVFPASEDISEKVSLLPTVKSCCLLRKEGKFKKWLGCISVAVCGFLFVLSFIFLIYWKLTSLGKSLISKDKAIGAAIQRAQRAGLHFSITLRNATIR